MRAGLSTRLVQLATERLDITDPVIRDHIQKLLAAQQEVGRALAALVSDLGDDAPEGIEAELEERVAALRDLQGSVLVAVAARTESSG